MAEDIVGSHMRPKLGYGDAASGVNSSIRKGEVIDRSPIGKALVDAMGPDPTAAATEAGNDWQTRPVSSAQAVPTHPGMRSRQHSGESVPAANVRKDKTGLARPTR